jgi:hypothetical protein
LYTATQNTVKSLRRNVYEGVINQPMQFHDSKDNSVGNITGVLASDTKEVNGASFETYAYVLQAFMGVLV